MRKAMLFLLLLSVGFLLSMAAGWIDVGLTRWPVKTFRDRDRSLVRLLAVDTTVEALTRAGRPPDSAFRGRSRIAPEETTVYRVRATFTRMFDGADGDMHLVLADPANPSRVLIAEIPLPLFSLGSGFGERFRREREEVRRRLPPRAQMVEVTGVGFFDYHRNRSRENGLELHPVIGLKFLSPAPTQSRRKPGF
ncbi:MAG: hypothetical protein ABJC07_10750 [Acidobacteriota bacterium]